MSVDHIDRHAYLWCSIFTLYVAFYHSHLTSLHALSVMHANTMKLSHTEPATEAFEVAAAAQQRAVLPLHQAAQDTDSAGTPSLGS